MSRPPTMKTQENAPQNYANIMPKMANANGLIDFQPGVLRVPEPTPNSILQSMNPTQYPPQFTNTSLPPEMQHQLMMAMMNNNNGGCPVIAGPPQFVHLSGINYIPAPIAQAQETVKFVEEPLKPVQSEISQEEYDDNVAKRLAEFRKQTCKTAASGGRKKSTKNLSRELNELNGALKRISNI